ncbi:MAG: MobA/MobL family protein [Bradyrhizobium sp.]|nr:MobA/MobL family protein [Bradyrhizobium sp.]
MAIFHLELKSFSRVKDETSVGKAAYRAGGRLTDRRRDLTFDYTRRSGIISTALLAPYGLQLTREGFWNSVEAAEKRRDAAVAREFTLALPAELSSGGRETCAIKFAKHLIAQFGVAADVALHEPSKSGDNRNYHAHVMIPTRSIMPDGTLSAKKLRDWDEKTTSRKIVTDLRRLFADLCNEELMAEGREERVDPGSHAARGDLNKPTSKLGVHAVNFERRTGQKSQRRKLIENSGSFWNDDDLVAALYDAGLAPPSRLPELIIGRPVFAGPTIDIRTILQFLGDNADKAVKRRVADALRAVAQKDNLIKTGLSRLYRDARKLERPKPFANIRQLTAKIDKGPSHGVVRTFAPISNAIQTKEIAALDRNDGPQREPSVAERSPGPAISFDPSPKRRRWTPYERTRLHAAAISMIISMDWVDADRSQFLRRAISIIANEFEIRVSDLENALGTISQSVDIKRIRDAASLVRGELLRYTEILVAKIIALENSRQLYPRKKDSQPDLWGDASGNTVADFDAIESAGAAMREIGQAIPLQKSEEPAQKQALVDRPEPLGAKIIEEGSAQYSVTARKEAPLTEKPITTTGGDRQRTGGPGEHHDASTKGDIITPSEASAKKMSEITHRAPLQDQAPINDHPEETQLPDQFAIAPNNSAAKAIGKRPGTIAKGTKGKGRSD